MKNLNNLKAAICLFTFNRLEETIKTVEALSNNFLAQEYDLKIFSDGPRNDDEKLKVEKVRNYLRTVNGFNTVEIFESERNKGLAKSIIEGVSKVFESNTSVIVLEDDLVTSPNYLDFMEQALEFYRNDKSIISISGFTANLPSLPGNKDIYFGYRASSWGWGTWKENWQSIDWEISDFETFIKDTIKTKRFKKGGSDLVRMLQNQMSGKIDSWAVRFCYTQFKLNQKTVFPTISKVESIGFGFDATHNEGTSRFKTTLDTSNKTQFEFEEYKKMDEKLVREFAKQFSLKTILLDKITQVFKK